MAHTHVCVCCLCVPEPVREWMNINRPLEEREKASQAQTPRSMGLCWQPAMAHLEIFPHCLQSRGVGMGSGLHSCPRDPGIHSPCSEQ